MIIQQQRPTTQQQQLFQQQPSQQQQQRITQQQQPVFQERVRRSGREYRKYQLNHAKKHTHLLGLYHGFVT